MKCCDFCGKRINFYDDGVSLKVLQIPDDGEKVFENDLCKQCWGQLRRTIINFEKVGNKILDEKQKKKDS